MVSRMRKCQFQMMPIYYHWCIGIPSVRQNSRSLFMLIFHFYWTFTAIQMEVFIAAKLQQRWWSNKISDDAQSDFPRESFALIENEHNFNGVKICSALELRQLQKWTNDLKCNLVKMPWIFMHEVKHKDRGRKRTIRYAPVNSRFCAW